MSRLTVLMPVYNGERFLRQAIESVLDQTYTDFEFLIINDGSTDHSREIIISYSDPRIRLVDQEQNVGLTPTLNRGLRMARTELIARQDADDISYPGRLEGQVSYMRSHPDVVLLGTQGTMIDHTGEILIPFDRSQDQVSIRWGLLFGNPFIHTSVMFRKNIIWDELGGYDESLSFCEDYDLWSRAVSAYPVANLRGRWVGYRAHSSSKTASMSSIREAEIRKVLEESLSWIFCDRAFSEDEMELLFRYRLGILGGDVSRYVALFNRLAEAYKRKFPEATTSKNFRRVLGWQQVRFASELLPWNRNFAFRLFINAFQSHPGVLPIIIWKLVRGNR